MELGELGNKVNREKWWMWWWSSKIDELVGFVHD